MHQVFLGIGGNLGNKPLNFQRVQKLVENEVGNIITKSSIYESPPWGFLAEEDFWNQVLYVETELEPGEVLTSVLEIENLFGRKRDAEYYESREMDIDILYFDNLSIFSETLTIPHPHIPDRMFILVPLAEIAPAFVHPVLQITNRELLEKCGDELSVKRIEL
jgi:2-amino-4-hydroxy-6-hydroxymethyldihydropteridine diphosphokinase